MRDIAPLIWGIVTVGLGIGMSYALPAGPGWILTLIGGLLVGVTIVAWGK